MERLIAAAHAFRVFLGERWGLAGWVGAALIIASSIVAQKYGMDNDTEHHSA